MFMSFGVSAMSCSRGVGMPPHRSSTALRSVMPALPRPGGPRKPGTSPTTCPPPAPTARSGVPRSPSSSGALALSLPICRRGGRRFFAGKEPPATGLSPGPTALSKSPRSARAAETAPPRGDRRSSRAVVSPPFPTALGRSPRCGETRSRGLPACSPLGDGITRLDTPEMPDGTSRSGTVSAPFSPRRRFSLRSRAESGARELGSSELFRLSSRAPPVLVLTIVESRRREPGDSVPSVSSANVAALSQNRGVTTDGASARFRESAPRRCALASGRAPAASREVSAESGLARGFSGRVAPPPRLPAREIGKNTSVGKGKVRTTTRSCPPRLKGGRFAAVRGYRGCRETKKNAPLRANRETARSRKSGRVRGCRVSGNGGSLAARTPARGAWGRNMARPDMARPVPSRARGVDRAARWRARAWGRASRGAPLEPRAGRGPRSTRRKTTMSGDTHLSVRGLGVGGRARARRPPCGARWDRLPRACAPGSSGACTGSRSGGRARL